MLEKLINTNQTVEDSLTPELFIVGGDIITSLFSLSLYS